MRTDIKEKHKMKLHKCSEIGLFATLLAVSVLFAGCVVCQTDEQYTGIENDALKQVECGQTTRENSHR